MDQKFTPQNPILNFEALKIFNKGLKVKILHPKKQKKWKLNVSGLK